MILLWVMAADFLKKIRGHHPKENHHNEKRVFHCDDSPLGDGRGFFSKNPRPSPKGESSWYNAFFIVMILLWVMAADFLKNRWDRKTWLRFAVCGAATGLLLVKFYIPYLRIAQPPDYSQNK